MNDPQPEDELVYDANCIVCLKSVGVSEGVSHFNMSNRWITICCPLCYEAFRADPQTYLGRKLPPREQDQPL